MESNRPGQPPVSDAATIAAELKQLAAAPATRFEFLALSEVEPKTMEIFKAAVAEGLGKPVDYVSSASGGFADTDSLMLLVDTSRFEIADAMELHRYAGLKGNFNNDAALRSRCSASTFASGCEAGQQNEQQVILGHRQPSGSR